MILKKRIIIRKLLGCSPPAPVAKLRFGSNKSKKYLPIYDLLNVIHVNSMIS